MDMRCVRYCAKVLAWCFVFLRGPIHFLGTRKIDSAPSFMHTICAVQPDEFVYTISCFALAMGGLCVACSENERNGIIC